MLRPPMLSSALLLLLCATPVKIAASGFVVSGGDDPARANVWLERFAEVVRRDGRVDVSTADDIAQLLGLERQRALLGCGADGTSCVAELANALGANGVLVGTFTKSEDSYLVVLRVLRQPSGTVWWSASARLKGEPALLDWLDEQAAACASALAPSATRGRAPLVVGGIGAGAVVIGATLLTLANTAGVQAVRTAPDEPALSSALSAGRGESTAGVVLVGVGAAALTASVLWWFIGAQKAPVALAYTPEGPVLTLGGRW
jgi:hypothetical protein